MVVGFNLSVTGSYQRVFKGIDMIFVTFLNTTSNCCVDNGFGSVGYEVL